MVKLSHFNVAVLQDGAPVKEYADPFAGESLKEETKYVEIKDRKSFIIRLTVDEYFKLDEYDALSVEINVDGEHMGGICFLPSSLAEGSEEVKLIKGFPYISDGKTCLRTLRFEEAEMSRESWRSMDYC